MSLPCSDTMTASAADTKKPGGVISEEALREKEAAVAGEGLSPAASRVSVGGAPLSSRSMAASTGGGPTSQRSMAGAVHRVSLGSTSPVTSHRQLEVVSSGSDDDAVRTCFRLLQHGGLVKTRTR